MLLETAMVHRLSDDRELVCELVTADDTGPGRSCKDTEVGEHDRSNVRSAIDRPVRSVIDRPRRNTMFSLMVSPFLRNLPARGVSRPSRTSLPPGNIQGHNFPVPPSCGSSPNYSSTDASGSESFLIWARSSEERPASSGETSNSEPTRTPEVTTSMTSFGENLSEEHRRKRRNMKSPGTLLVSVAFICACIGAWFIIAPLTFAPKSSSTSQSFPVTRKARKNKPKRFSNGQRDFEVHAMKGQKWTAKHSISRGDDQLNQLIHETPLSSTENNSNFSGFRRKHAKTWHLWSITAGISFTLTMCTSFYIFARLKYYLPDEAQLFFERIQGCFACSNEADSNSLCMHLIQGITRKTKGDMTPWAFSPVLVWKNLKDLLHDKAESPGQFLLGSKEPSWASNIYSNSAVDIFCHFGDSTPNADSKICDVIVTLDPVAYMYGPTHAEYVADEVAGAHICQVRNHKNSTHVITIVSPFDTDNLALTRVISKLGPPSTKLWGFGRGGKTATVHNCSFSECRIARYFARDHKWKRHLVDFRWEQKGDQIGGMNVNWQSPYIFTSALKWVGISPMKKVHFPGFRFQLRPYILLFEGRKKLRKRCSQKFESTRPKNVKRANVKDPTAIFPTPAAIIRMDRDFLCFVSRTDGEADHRVIVVAAAVYQGWGR